MTSRIPWMDVAKNDLSWLEFTADVALNGNGCKGNQMRESVVRYFC